MLFRFLVPVLVLLLTGFYARQGLFSALITLIAAVFASLLTLTLYEPLSAIIAAYKPAPARGTTFLLIFFLTLSLSNLGWDYAVQKNIRFTKMIDLVAGRLVSFLAAMVIVGTALIGFEMLPLHTSLMGFGSDTFGFDRYDAKTGMEGDQPGVAAAPCNVFLAPDRLVLAVWNGASGRGLGGGEPFASVHPDLIVESYGYRNTVQYGANNVLPPDLLAVGGAYVSADPDVLAKCQIQGDKQAAVIRIDVTQGGEQPKTSADPDVKFRVTPSEVRLVTDKDRQYYPIGHLVNGTTFERLPLDTGHLIDDYVGGKVIEDWVFAIDKDEKPTMIEVKQLARVDLTSKLSSKPFPALAQGVYPKRDYKFNHGSVRVVVNGPAGPIGGAKVYLMPQTTKVNNVRTEVQTAYDAMKVAVDQMNQGIPPWNTAMGKPGVPSEGDFREWLRLSRENITLKGPDDDARWEEIIPTVLVGGSKSDGATNIASLPGFFETRVVPMLKVNSNDLRGQGTTASDGSVELPDIAPGSYSVICSAHTESAYYVWCVQVVVAEKKQVSTTLSPKTTSYSLQLKP